MKKNVFVLLTCFLFAAFVQHSIGQDLSPQQKSHIEKEVDSVFHTMIRAAERLDYDFLNLGVNDSQKAGFILNGTCFLRFDSLMNSVRIMSQGISGQTISVLGQKITAISGTIVLLVAWGNAQVAVSSGNSFGTSFYWSFVYEKIGVEWKVIQSHQSGYR